MIADYLINNPLVIFSLSFNKKNFHFFKDNLLIQNYAYIFEIQND